MGRGPLLLVVVSGLIGLSTLYVTAASCGWEGDACVDRDSRVEYAFLATMKGVA